MLPVQDHVAVGVATGATDCVKTENQVESTVTIQVIDDNRIVIINGGSDTTPSSATTTSARGQQQRCAAYAENVLKPRCVLAHGQAPMAEIFNMIKITPHRNNVIDTGQVTGNRLQSNVVQTSVTITAGTPTFTGIANETGRWWNHRLFES
jgi:hypothetical protein